MIEKNLQLSILVEGINILISDRLTFLLFSYFLVKLFGE